MLVNNPGASLRYTPKIYGLANARIASVAFFLLMVVVLLGPWISYRPQPFTAEGSPLRQLAHISLLATAAITAGALIYPARVMVLPWSMVLLLGWCWLSLTWAIEPGIAMRRLALTSILIWTVFLIVDQLGFSRTIGVLRLITTIFLFANYVAAIGFPALGVHQAADFTDNGIVGSWCGVLGHKNFAGAVCAFAIMILIFDRRPGLQLWRIVLILGNAVFLYKTASKTSMGLLVLSICAGWVYMRYNPRYRLFAIIGIFVFAVPVAMAIDVYWNELMAPFNRQDALTGRVQIWPPLINYASDHWLLGSGFGSFWNIGVQNPIYRYAKGWVIMLGNGHNGYLDMLIQIGFPGLLLAVGVIFLNPLLMLLTSPHVGSRRGLLTAMLLFVAGHNVTETSLMERDTIVQTFLMLTVALIHRVSRSRPIPSEHA